MGDARFVVALCAACCLSAACSAHVNEFSAEPRHIITVYGFGYKLVP